MEMIEEARLLLQDQELRGMSEEFWEGLVRSWADAATKRRLGVDELPEGTRDTKQYQMELQFARWFVKGETPLGMAIVQWVEGR